MKRILSKTLALILIIMMLAMYCNVSFASNITLANIKESLEKCFRQDIIIKADGEKTTLNGESEDMTITDSKIGGKAEGVDYTFFNYSLSDNVCTFDTNFTDLYKEMKVDFAGLSKEEITTNNALMALGILVLMEECYISTADCVGKDLSLAVTYYEQQLSALSNNEEKVDININNDIFSIVMKSNEKNILETASLKVNLDNLADLSESKIDKNKTIYKVYLGQLPDSEREALSTNYKLDSIPNKAYTGKDIKPSVKIIEKETGFDAYLDNGRDFTISYSNNKNTGKAIVTVTGIGDYKGTLTKIFYIVPKKVTGVTNKTQGQTTITVKWDKAEGATGYELEKYDTSKKKYVKVTSKAITKNLYKVKGLKAANTYKFRVRAYKKIDGKKYYGAYSKVTKLTTKTKTQKVLKVTAGKKKITVKFNTVLGTDGYQVQYSTDKNFKKNNNTTNASKKSTSKTISKLKSKKKYYVRIRAYRTVNGKKVYSSYSSIKNVKVK